MKIKITHAAPPRPLPRLRDATQDVDAARSPWSSTGELGSSTRGPCSNPRNPPFEPFGTLPDFNFRGEKSTIWWLGIPCLDESNLKRVPSKQNNLLVEREKNGNNPGGNTAWVSLAIGNGHLSVTPRKYWFPPIHEEKEMIFLQEGIAVNPIAHGSEQWASCYTHWHLPSGAASFKLGGVERTSLDCSENQGTRVQLLSVDPTGASPNQLPSWMLEKENRTGTNIYIYIYIFGGGLPPTNPKNKLRSIQNHSQDTLGMV